MVKKLKFAMILTAIIAAVFLCAGTASAAEGAYRDVPPDSPCYAAVEWLTEAGVVNGVGGGLYCPDAYVSLDELVTMLLRLYYPGEALVGDGITENWADPYVSTAVRVGLLGREEYEDRVFVAEGTNAVISCDALENRAVWLLLDRIHTFPVYPCWAYDSGEPASFSECIFESLSASLERSALCAEGKTRASRPTRGDVAVMLFRVENEPFETPAPPLAEVLEMTDDGTSDAKKLRISRFNVFAAAAKLPQKYIRLFSENGWTLRFVDDILSSNGGHYAGMTSFGPRVVTIATGGSNAARGEIIMNHEMGHFVQWSAGQWDAPLVEDLLKVEGQALSRFTGTYALTNAHEYFAEAFDFIHRNRGDPVLYGQMRETLPRTLAYIEKCYLDAEGIVDLDAIAWGGDGG